MENRLGFFTESLPPVVQLPPPSGNPVKGETQAVLMCWRMVLMCCKPFFRIPATKDEWQIGNVCFIQKVQVLIFWWTSNKFIHILYIYIILKVPYLYNIYIAIIFRDIHTSIIYHMVIQNWLSHSDDPESGSDPPSHLWFRWFSQRRPPVFRGIFCIISRGCCSVFHCFWLYVEGFSIVFPWFSMF